MSDTWFLYSFFALFFVSLFIQDFSHFREKNMFFVRYISLLILYLLSLTMTSFTCFNLSCSWSQTISFRCTPNSFPVFYCLFPIGTPTGNLQTTWKNLSSLYLYFLLTHLPPFTQQPAGNFCTHFLFFFFSGFQPDHSNFYHLFWKFLLYIQPISSESQFLILSCLAHFPYLSFDAW